MREPYVVRIPLVRMRSLWAMGRPCSGPTAAPCANASSAARAPAIARSGSRVTMAFTLGLTRSIWVRWASTTSRADSSLARIRRARSVAVMKHRSVVDMDVSSQAVVVVCVRVIQFSEPVPVSLFPPPRWGRARVGVKASDVPQPCFSPPSQPSPARGEGGEGPGRRGKKRELNGPDGTLMRPDVLCYACHCLGKRLGIYRRGGYV